MGWLVRRAMVMWVILIVICAGVIGIMRANAGQDKLQAFGFEMCNGEPCFRGIKVGMPWSEALRLSQDATEVGPPIVFDFSKVGEGVDVAIYPSDNKKAVEAIILATSRTYYRLLAKDIVQHFGNPCRVELKGDRNGVYGAELVYPRLKAGVLLQEFRIATDSKVWAITIKNYYESDACFGPPELQVDSWHGFTSVDMYVAPHRRALGLTR
jgi:hypothetical protein